MSSPDLSVPFRQTRSAVADDGVPIVYDYYPGSDRTETVVVIPGFWRTRRWPSLERFAALLVARGHTVAVLDVRGHGESGGTYTFNREEVRDVEAVARDLPQRGEGSRCHLVGFSIGGAIATCTAARARVAIASLILVSPVAKFGWIRPRLKPWKSSKHLSAGQALRMPRFEWSFGWSRKECAVDSIPQVTAPTLIIHTRNDWLVHHRHGEALQAAAAGRSELHLLALDDGYHADRIFSAAPDVAEQLIFEFIDRQKRKRPLKGGR